MQFVNQQKWFYRRFIKKTRRIKLGFNNLYIFPNLFGLYWVITTVVLYVLGTNLENNFTIFICYLMVAVLLISLFLTHFNIHGLEIISTNQKVNFANSKINYKIILNSKKYRNNIKLKFLNKENKTIFIEKIEDTLIKSLTIESKQRGIYTPDIIYGESSSPLSLCTCWFYWKPVDKLIVAPEIKKARVNKEINLSKMNSRDKKNNATIGDDLIDIQIYKKGEKKSLIYWKSLARSGPPLSKNFNNENLKNNWLILNKHLPIEKALEHLCFEIYNQYKNNSVYGVFISKNKFIQPDKSEKHYLKCLTILASYKNEEI
jgi:uncharacterized protein (DUF58 family)